MASLCSDMISREAHWKTLKNYVDKYIFTFIKELAESRIKTVTYRNNNKSTK